jgi:hypothetical protein
MKTTLRFEGPSDLSVGTIRIHGEGQSVADWVATPGNVSFQTDNIKPGVYATDIGPAGIAPQSVIFEVREGEDNAVVLPPFSALSASGSNTSYFDTRSLQTFDHLPAGLKLDLAESPLLTAGGAALPSTHAETPPPEATTLLRLSEQTNRVSIGLSEETRGPDSFDTFRSPARMELFAGRVELDIPQDPERDLWAARRVRLSTAIERVRIERCLLPLYQGGTKITVSTPPFAPSDVEFNVTPVDPHARALLRALDAGTSAEAEAVYEHVVHAHLKTDPSTASDPWVAMLVGLLSVRFPKVFTSIDHRWSASLARHAGWAFDTHVIHASHVLRAASGDDKKAQDEAVVQVVSLFAKAQAAGSPYYRYTNQLFAEMADGIARYLEQALSQIPAKVVARFARVHRRWLRELPLQRGAGASFTWLTRDPKALRVRGVLLPNRHPSGRLPAHRTLVVFEGELGAGKISLLRRRPPGRRQTQAGGGLLDQILASKYPGLGGAWSQVSQDFLTPRESISSDRPAATHSTRDRLWSSDPNKGKFGRRSSRNGFTLNARFEQADSPDLVTVILTVTADETVRIGLEDYARFILHPTFSPAEVKVPFRAGRAQLRIQAWGGFTVGVRLSRGGIVLECNLAKVDGAPELIRTR